MTDLADFCPKTHGPHQRGAWSNPKPNRRGRLQRVRYCTACNKQREFYTVPYAQYPKFGYEAPLTKEEEKTRALSNSMAEAESRWPEVERLLKKEPRYALVADRVGRKRVELAIAAGRALKEIRELFVARSGFQKWAEGHGLKHDTTNRYLLLGWLTDDYRPSSTIAEAVKAGREAKRKWCEEEARKRVEKLEAEEGKKLGALVEDAERRVEKLEAEEGKDLGAARKHLKRLKRDERLIAPTPTLPADQPVPTLRRRGFPEGDIDSGLAGRLADLEQVLLSLGWSAVLTVTVLPGTGKGS